MMCRSLFLIAFYLIGLSDSIAQVASPETPIERYYTNAALSRVVDTNILLKGNILHIVKFKSWLNAISEVPIGRQTLLAIIGSSHSLVIVSKKSARISAGRTLAAMTDRLTNGTGDDVEIWFDGSVRENGSHMVYNTHRQLVEYTAVENLFHELVHAKHKMNGSWRYFDSEGQAIAEENVFRRQYSILKNKPLTERTYKTGVPIESLVDHARSECRHIIKIRANPPITVHEPCS